jgi:FtsP/CotA-like multicopper oxidase with cupredoxin domain
MSTGMDQTQMNSSQMQGMAMGGGQGGSQGSGMSMGQTSGHSADAGAAGMAMDLNDVVYDAFLANDRTLADPEVVRVEPRGRVLLRVINAAAASNFQIDLGQVQAKLVAVDGRPIRPLTGSVFPIAMAQRLDLEFQLAADQTVVPVLAGLEGERKRTGIVLATARGQVPKLPDLASTSVPPLGFTFEQSLRAMMPLTPKPADRVHRVDLTGSMTDYVWEINGRTYGQDKPLMVAKGQRVELLMSNHTMMSHPMHLHGHPFQVVAFNGRRFSGALRDTVLVPPRQSVTVAFDADNPGRWAFHCHNLYHMGAGMMTTVQYENF